MFDPTAIFKMLGTGGAGAAIPIVVMYGFFTQEDDFNRHVADSARGFILDTIERAVVTEPGEYKDSLCRTLQESISELCSAAPEDSICVDRAIYFERAGC